MVYSVYRYEIYFCEGAENENSIDYVDMIPIFVGFDTYDQVKHTLDGICDYLPKDAYLVIKFDEGKPVEVSGVYFVGEDDAFMDCAEHDFRVTASIGLGVDLV